jgi:hypothetical protein
VNAGVHEAPALLFRCCKLLDRHVHREVRDGCYAIVANELLPIHCGRALLCGLTQVCSCDANECFAENVASQRELTVTLDAADPDVLRLVPENNETRYLRRQQP